MFVPDGITVPGTSVTFELRLNPRSGRSRGADNLINLAVNQHWIPVNPV